MFHRSHLAAVAIATTLPIGLTTIAPADVVTSSYVSSSNYHFELDSMPDFDQMRQGLGADSDGNPGGMYCGPASSMNLMGYIGTHGFPSVGLTAADWENEEDYSYVTTLIEDMANLSNTHRIDGTNYNNGYNGLVDYLDAACPGVFTVSGNLATRTTGPTLRSLSENGINGAITKFGYGRYYLAGTDIWGRLVLTRDGGHAVSFVEGYRSGDTRNISFRDPALNYDFTTQSTFVSMQYDVEPIPFVESNSVIGSGFLGDRNGSRIMRSPSDGYYRILDSAIHIRPRSGYSWRTSDRCWKRIVAGGLGWWSSSPTYIPGPLDTELVDFTIGPFNNSIWYVDTGSLSKASQVRLADHEVTTFDLPHPAGKIAFARDHALLTLGAGMLSRLHPFAQSTQNAPETITVQVPGQPEYMVLDDTDDSIWLADLESAQASQYPQVLDMPGQTFPFPDHQVPFVNFAVTGNPDMPLALVDATGLILLCTPDTTINRLVAIDQIWTDGTIASLQFNDEGDLMLFNGDGMKMYRRTLNGWSETQAHPFEGSAFSARTVMSRNRINFDPEQHTGEGWRNIVDVDVLHGDINQDGIVGIDDLLALLSAFGQQDEDADLDGDGIVGITDLLELLGNWTA
ncbi:MAG: hypothetical protein MK116_13495 [Phycisphaerales bacterium]|nr:hypothetical protein [Phycisphaerales bacterium]